MLSYCMKYRKNLESKNPRVPKTNKEKPILLLKFAVCDGKKTRFIKYQKASGLLSSLRIKSGLNKIPIVGPVFFISRR